MHDPRDFHPRRPGLVRPAAIDPAGVTGPTPGQARGPGWRRTSHGHYVPASTDLTDVSQRIATAAPLLGPEWEAVTGWAALWWRGASWFRGLAPDGTDLPVPLVLARHCTRQAGFSISQEFVRPGEIETVDGLPVTTAVRSLCFEMRYAAHWRRAVVLLDMTAYADLVSVAEATAYTATLTAWTGVPQLRRALPHADENAWSPQESLMRLCWTEDAGLPRPLCNRPVFGPGGEHLGTPDLIDPEAGVVGEYDGELHLAAERRWRDIEREAAFRAVGLETVTMMRGDVADPYRFVGRLHAAYGRARAARPVTRGWTLTPPPWWVPTHTVALRRQLDDSQRQRVLGYRHAA